MIIAEWSVKGLFKADPNAVAEEIYEIGEEVTPGQVLDKARAEDTELHKCFDWNDETAAEKWRLQTARQVINHLVIKMPEQKEDEQSPRVFYKVSQETGSGYQRTEYVVKNINAYQELLNQAMRELRAFKEKYKMLTELEEILSLIS